MRVARRSACRRAALPRLPPPEVALRRHSLKDLPRQTRRRRGSTLVLPTMSKEEIIRNITLSANFLASQLKKNWQNVGSLYIKSTMGPSFQIYF